MDHWIGEYSFQEHGDILTTSLVIATGRSLIREIAAMPDDSMSFIEAANEVNVDVQM
jgi:hypothetical protein